MTLPEIKILSVLLITLVMFIWGRWRHDVIALGALIACVALGLVTADTAFYGFGHPAVITVAAVLVLSFSLQATGAIDVVAHKLTPSGGGVMTTIASLTGLAAVLSAFMNNVGAMALLMPIAIQLANKLSIPAGRVLMPVAFGSILGGMTTLIGTPPNLIVSGIRAEALGEGFQMFDFAPVGILVAGAGVVFIAILGWRFVPKRERTDAEGFDTGKYLTEVRVSEGGKADGMTVGELDQALQESEAEVIGLVRGKIKVVNTRGYERLSKGDLLVIKAEPETLSQALNVLGLRLVDNVTPPDLERDEEEDDGDEKLPPHVDEEFEDRPAWFDRKVTAYGKSTLRGGITSRADADAVPRASDNSEVVLVEMVVLPDSQLIGTTAADLRLRSRLGLNLLAISFEGNQRVRRLRRTKIQSGSVLLLQGEPDALAQFAANAGCVPLAERTVRVPSKKRAMFASGIMIAAVAAAAMGITSAAVAFTAGVFAVMALRVIPLRQVYESIDWTVVVLLAALIPVAMAMEQTGAADTLVDFILTYMAAGNAVIALTWVLVLTTLLSSVMNNAATAAVMCPVALSTASQLQVNPDAFLMAVAVGASCAFLTPIAHQNNTLILGPGGFKFGDYWRLGLPLEIIVIAIGVPALLFFWPL
ncbi:SLC13 family permease [Aliidiomarina halalkaliphila]|uniref:SLC13 family permease n=1 Tax=Aliidiomarina halalkaliphila TaxID=2593535 RepID=A0A552X168_9GAMM|nr:SLC13 family permease [Aliidiomarina halalkaliphila]TRW48777.1 SLC13 family permease [Aliidiomarina halalkaliphila]